MRKVTHSIFYSLLLTVVFFGACQSKTESMNTGQDQGRSLLELQQEFLDLRFGMFLCMGSSTFVDEDWADPQFDPALFNPVGLDANQWAAAAQSAGMTYGIFTSKHHDGFALWDTETTDHGVMSSPYKKDVVAEFVTAFRENGLKVVLYYSMLDVHHNVRPGWIDREKVEFVKNQLTELLTNYGEVTAIVFDGWDAFWSRISYEEIPFEEIYLHIKSIQPDCLIEEHNAEKYPSEGLFYTDLKHYEQNAGQQVDKDHNIIPAQSGIPLNRTWFWKTFSPTEKLKKADDIVFKNLIPLNDAYCNFVLGIVPNRQGLIDENALAVLNEIGQKWQHPGPAKKIPKASRPIIASNLAKGVKSSSSWSYDIWIADFGNNDNFRDAWVSSSHVDQPWYEVTFDQPTAFNAIMIYEQYRADRQSDILKYELQYSNGDEWVMIPVKPDSALLRYHRFDEITAKKIRILCTEIRNPVRIAEFGIYNETVR